MPLDPYIARGVQPIDVTNAMYQGANLQMEQQRTNAFDQRNALLDRRWEQESAQRQSQEVALKEGIEVYTRMKAGDPSAFEYAIGKASQNPQFAAFAQSNPEGAREALMQQLEMTLGVKPDSADKPPGSYQEYLLAQKDPGYASHLEGSRPKPASVNLSVNTAEGFYGALSKDQALKFSALAEAAQSAPARIERADRVLTLLSATPYTGAAADYKLAFGKAAKAAGFDYGGDDISNTEALASELAGATLDAIKTSGLGSGQGFTDKDRQFLEKASAGNITLDNATLRRLAILNKKAGIATVNQYNERAKRLKADQLDIMGMPQTVQPGSELTPAEAAELEALRAKYGKPR